MTDVHAAAIVRVTLSTGGYGEKHILIGFPGTQQNEVIRLRDLGARNEWPEAIARKLREIEAQYNVPGWVVDKETGWLCHVDESFMKSVRWRRKQVHTLCHEQVYSYGEPKACARPVYDDDQTLCGMHAKKEAKELHERAIEQARIDAQQARREAIAAEREAKAQLISDRYNQLAAAYGFSHLRQPTIRSYNSQDVIFSCDRFLEMCDAILGPVIVEEPVIEVVEIEEAEEPFTAAGIESPFG